MSNRREDFRRETGGYEWRPGRWFFGALGVVLVGYLGLVAVTAVTLPFRTAHGVSERIADPDNVIFQYEKFHDLCAGVVSLDGQHATAQKALSDHEAVVKGQPDPVGQNATETARLRGVVTGISQARIAKAQEYNADSRKWTQDLFKSRSLPWRIEDGITPSCD